MARTIALEGFVYGDGAENIRPVQRQVDSLLKDLGPLKSLAYSMARVRVGVRGSAEVRDVWLYVYVNKATGVYLGFYVRQGSSP